MHRLNRLTSAWSSDRLNRCRAKHVDTFKPTMPDWVVEHRDWVTAERKSQARVARHRFKAMDKTSLRRSSWMPTPDGKEVASVRGLRCVKAAASESKSAPSRVGSVRVVKAAFAAPAGEILRTRKDESFGALLNSSS